MYIPAGIGINKQYVYAVHSHHDSLMSTQDAETNWQFDIFGYADATPGNSLSMLGFHLLKTTGLVQEFQLNETKLAACLRKIESGYKPTNPYHNSIHVASVLQMTHMLLVHGGVMKSKVMDRVHQVASYWAAIVHDFEHGGVNNDFLVKTGAPLAIRYNDSSPWENHHLAASCQVLHQPEYCFPPVSAPTCCAMHAVLCHAVFADNAMPCCALVCCSMLYDAAPND